MSRKFITNKIAVVLVFLLQGCAGQNIKQLPPGFPDRSPELDVLPGFKNPPDGYGEVSFYWWIGDTLTKEKILWELNQLENNNIAGLQINYCHSDTGGATYGLTYPSQPALFSQQWWKLFQWFAKEANRRGMSVSLSDYTLGAAGQGWYIDEMLNEYPHLYGSKLESKQFDIEGNENFQAIIPENILTAVAYQKKADGTLSLSSLVDLKSRIIDSKLKWQPPAGDWKIVLIYINTIETSFDPMNSLSGKTVAEKFYQRFEEHYPGESGKGLNFFFSDELQFGIRGFLWNDNFAEEFKKSKGYDILTELPSLFINLGPRSYKVRLDYNDVMVSLTEEGFFKPIYTWHNSRGMLFGCDHGGRGRDVTEFGDYFRTQRWMSGPGCDQPGLGKNIIKNKVASSISHLYERPRTWLEGFYGSGWGTSSEELADATFANFAMGHNLLSLHALYYTTFGSWWEWAPPDNHFRQPYWEHMDRFLKCSERLSYVLSQGVHRCDVALVYPVAPTVANIKGKESTAVAFNIANDLYPSGIDFDFMDFESLERCEIRNQELHVSGEKYKVLILPSMSAVRFSTVEKALDFFRSGGIVIAAGALPEVSDRIGGYDKELQAMIKEMFGTTFSEKHDSTIIYSKKNEAGGSGIYVHDPIEVKKLISTLIQPDFEVLADDLPANILHRKAGIRDIYFVYGIPKGTKCFFRCFGKAELWNPWNGTTSSLKVTSVSEDGTIITLPLEKSEPQLIVFSPGKPEIEKTTVNYIKIKDTLIIDNDWGFELKPTLDNKFGDYRLPAFDEMVGVEVWEMKYSKDLSVKPVAEYQNFKSNDWSKISVSYGPFFWKLGPLPSIIDSRVLEEKLSSLRQIDPDKPVVIDNKNYFWQPYEFSWRWGLKNDAGHQGYHGLKGKVNNELISLGKINISSKHSPVYPLEKEKEGSIYYLWTTVNSPQKMNAKIKKDGLLPERVYVNQKFLKNEQKTVELKMGNNPVLLKYINVGRGYFVFEKEQANNDWKQSVPLSTEWYLNPSILPYESLPDIKNAYAWYHFMGPPGAHIMYVQSVSKPETWISGNKISCQEVEAKLKRITDESIPLWKMIIPDSIVYSSPVVLKIKQTPGNIGGAAIPEPVWFVCKKGKIRIQNLEKVESLRTYSGGLLYSKTLNLKQEQVTSDDIKIDLGRVVASAEVVVNGESIGYKVIPPWKFNLTGKLSVGDNLIEILVYNTLGNHFLTTPSKYIGRTDSGLMGPIRLEFVNLKK